MNSYTTKSVSTYVVINFDLNHIEIIDYKLLLGY